MNVCVFVRARGSAGVHTFSTHTPVQGLYFCKHTCVYVNTDEHAPKH